MKITHGLSPLPFQPVSITFTFENREELETAISLFSVPFNAIIQTSKGLGLLYNRDIHTDMYNGFQKIYHNK